MAIYLPEKFNVQNGLDDRGLSLGLQRLDGEELGAYRLRLDAESKDPATGLESSVIKSLGRVISLLDTEVFSISLIEDVNDIPLAVDPYIEITSSHIRLYNDYANNDLDIEILFTDRTNGYFLRDIFTAIDASTYFDIGTSDPDYEFKRGKQLRIDNSRRFKDNVLLLDSRSNKLEDEFIDDIVFRNASVFKTEVFTLEDVDEDGKYYVDYLEGVVFTYSPGVTSVAYTYNDFPFRVFWQPCRVIPYNDEDKNYLYCQTTIDDDTGQEVYNLVNAKGAEIINKILDASNLTWGR